MAPHIPPLFTSADHDGVIWSNFLDPIRDFGQSVSNYFHQQQKPQIQKNVMRFILSYPALR